MHGDAAGGEIRRHAEKRQRCRSSISRLAEFLAQQAITLRPDTSDMSGKV